jgi:hypothetical protein
MRNGLCATGPGLTLTGVPGLVQYVRYGAAPVAAVAVSSVIGRQHGRS